MEMRIVLESNLIKEIIATLSQMVQVQYRMTKNGVELYRSDKLFGKLYNEHLYLLYKTDQLSEVPQQDMGKLEVILKSSYITAGTS
jgi:TfoX/Sxy family transcriptional regulator of competence genes